MNSLIVEFGGFWGDFLKTFLEGSADHVIYRDYIMNQRFFIYCSLAFLGYSLNKTVHFLKTFIHHNKQTSAAHHQANS